MSEDVVTVDVLLGDEWTPIDVDVDGLTFREIDEVRGVLDGLHSPTARTNTLVAAWITYKRTHPDVAVDVFLDLPIRSMREGERAPVGEVPGVG
jgi:hypothetical protein